MENSTMKREELKQYFDTMMDEVDINIFEIEESTSEIKHMKIKDFKALAEKAGLLNKVPEDQAFTVPLDPEEVISSSFEVIED